MRELDDQPDVNRSLSEAAAAGYLYLMTDGDAATAHRLLVEAIGSPVPTDADLSPALFTLMLT